MSVLGNKLLASWFQCTDEAIKDEELMVIVEGLLSKKKKEKAWKGMIV